MSVPRRMAVGDRTMRLVLVGVVCVLLAACGGTAPTQAAPSSSPAAVEAVTARPIASKAPIIEPTPNPTPNRVTFVTKSAIQTLLTIEDLPAGSEISSESTECYGGRQQTCADRIFVGISGKDAASLRLWTITSSSKVYPSVSDAQRVMKAKDDRASWLLNIGFEPYGKILRTTTTIGDESYLFWDPADSYYFVYRYANTINWVWTIAPRMDGLQLTQDLARRQLVYVTAP